jgi:hypothetical protein
MSPIYTISARRDRVDERWTYHILMVKSVVLVHCLFDLLCLLLDGEFLVIALIVGYDGFLVDRLVFALFVLFALLYRFFTLEIGVLVISRHS